MDFQPLNFLANEFFVLSWYVSGFIFAIWVFYDVHYVNKSVNKALKAGWPVIIFFFSILGLVLYLWTCRPKGIPYFKKRINTKSSGGKVHHNYVASTFSKVTGSVIHCVAGDGLGIMTAMVIGRYIGLRFWSEFAFEYIAGFLFGWILFQYPAMRSMGNTPKQALWKGGRDEFFSMITLMFGMLITMKFIQPYIVTLPPMPNTYAFWGIAALALFIGTIITYPINWWLVSIGWKHGMS